MGYSGQDYGQDTLIRNTRRCVGVGVGMTG